MVAVRKSQATLSEIVTDPSVMSGEAVVRGTRVPALTILAYLRAGHSSAEIFADYPTLPLDGIDAVAAWAERQFGENWRDAGSLPVA